MGRIKTSFVKRKTHQLFEKDSEGYTTDFNENKILVEKNATFYSKKLRNVVAGYVTRLKRTEDRF